MIQIENWMEDFTAAVKSLFGNRVIFIGLQGSYGRGEAGEDSDIDPVVILDTLSLEDLARYDEMLSALPERDKICGFLSGRQVLVDWEKSDLFQFYHDTRPVEGSLDFLRPLIREEDVRRAVLLGACNVYHMCCHNFVHEKSSDILKGLYKSASFSLRAKHYCETGRYVGKMRELAPLLSGWDRDVAEGMDDKNFAASSRLLMEWAEKVIEQFS